MIDSKMLQVTYVKGTDFSLNCGKALDGELYLGKWHAVVLQLR